MSSLKQFIRNVRAAKTIADERAVVQKESAAIRASFREESHDSNIRRNNVAKLLYLFTLGERTHFGQIECLKLLASPRFADKRLGYLGTMLLLDENQEVLTLVTNSLSNDLKHSNQYVVGLALCTLANIASIEMSRDLFPEVESMISSGNAYIRRKAALCAMKICRKVPDLQEHFIEKAKLLLNDKNHGVLICGLTLITSMCEASEEMEEEEGTEPVTDMFKPLTGSLVKLLKGLASSGYAPEHDVTGVADPFLQVKVLRLFRVLGRGDSDVSEQINDILAQVATNTDSSKNVGNSILYETVLTILEIEADSGLRVLGVNILGKFLSNKDNNIRYVALNTLTKVVAIEPNAVQRHRNTILECLRDPDISIRRRALELSFTLINEGNVRVLIRELLSFLEVADNEFKPELTSQIGISADRFAPNKRWHIDTMLRVLKLAGNYVKEQILSSFVRLIATSPDLQTYSVQKLYANLKDDISQEGLTLAGAWVIGEFGDMLLRGGTYEEEELVKEVTESDVVDLYSKILNSNFSSQAATQYIVTSVMKLTTRFQQPAQVERLRRLLMGNQTNLDVEIQQRALEYGNLFGFDQIRRGVLEKMPPPEIKDEQRVLGEANTRKRQTRTNTVSRKNKPSKMAEQDMLLDLMGGDSDVPATSTAANGNSQNNADLLADILGGGGGMTSPPTTNNNVTQQSAAAAAGGKSTTNQDIMGLFDAGAQTQPSAPQNKAPSNSASMDLLNSDSSSFPSQQQQPLTSGPNFTTAYQANAFHLSIGITKRDASGVNATAKFQNSSITDGVSALNLQVAVPKAQKLQLQALGKDELDPGEEASQSMRVVGVNGPPPARLRLRLRLSYLKDGQPPTTEQVDWSEPA
ncbi:MAG: clathrin associated protein complex large subunit [Alyxoria varia]|nr:MAG: clathrin associated protein complex large subunit [Alyxoria varia]